MPTFTATPTGGSPIPFYDLNFNFQFASSASCTGVGNCSVDAVGLSTGGTITGPVTGTFDPTPVITNPNGLISAGSYGGFASIAPATWIEIYGTNLATVQSQTWGSADFNGVNAPTALGGTKVTVDGLAAYIDFVSPNQVNAYNSPASWPDFSDFTNSTSLCPMWRPITPRRLRSR